MPAQGYGSILDWARAHYAQYGQAEGRMFATGAAFAGEGVYSRPTSFDMGLMAERGPEAVMPLVNVGGSLGVRAVSNDNGTSALVAEIRELRKDIDELKAEQRKTTQAAAGAGVVVSGAVKENNALTKEQVSAARRAAAA